MEKQWISDRKKQLIINSLSIANQWLIIKNERKDMNKEKNI